MRQLLRDRLGLLLAIAGPLALTAALAPITGPKQATNVAFAYLIVILAAAARGGIAPGVVASVIGFVLFNFFFIEPLYSLTVSARGDVGVLLGFLVTSLVVSALVASVERRRDEAEQEAADTQLLYDLSVSLAGPREEEPALPAVAMLVQERLDLDAVAIAVRHGDSLQIVHDGGKSEHDVRRTLGFPGKAPMLAAARLSSGDELLIAAYPRRGQLMTPRHERLLSGIAALAVATADRIEQQHQRRQVEILQETDRQRAALLAAVSHDLRSPLAAITTAASALDSDSLSADVHRELTASITLESERLDRMVRNLLDLGRIEGGALVADREPVPVDELIGGVLTRVRPRLGERELGLHVPDELPQVLIDPVQVDQALANLVDNVLTHTPPEAGLQIQAAAGGGWVTIRVADEGPGIPREERELIFDRFGRGSAAKSGSGLGLAIARAFAEASGGRLEYADASRGSAFDLFLRAQEGGP